MEFFVMSILCFFASLAGFPLIWVVEWLEGRKRGKK